jgi:glycine/D-amino acid oxidase-like deaminating enzyme
VLPILLKPALDALPVPPLQLAACVFCGAALAALWAASAKAARARQPRVVIVGGGFAGLQAALELQHWAREVTVVDRASYFEYTPGVLQGLASGDVRPCHRPHSRSLTRAKLMRVPQTATMRVGDHELELSAVSAGPAAPQVCCRPTAHLQTHASHRARCAERQQGKQ